MCIKRMCHIKTVYNVYFSGILHNFEEVSAAIYLRLALSAGDVHLGAVIYNSYSRNVATLSEITKAKPAGVLAS